MLVYILNKNEKALMPCSPKKARLLLKEKKAKVVKKTPFTLKLLYGSSGYKQPVSLGVDSGYYNIGLSALDKEKELYAAQVNLRKDLVKLNSERASYRRTRRSRKLWYRKPRCNNRVKAKKEGWVAPSFRNKVDAHIRVINNVNKILPISKITLEIASFDIQKIKNPEIEGKGYQRGGQLGFYNVREYVLYRDGHKCRNKKCKSKDNILQVHHLKSRQTGGDRPDNLITLCKTCHDKYHKGKISLENIKKGKGYKAETFMTSVRWKIFEELKQKYTFPIKITYGYITKSKRINTKISKSHINDAFVITEGAKQHRAKKHLILQYRRTCRKLHKEFIKGAKRPKEGGGGKDKLIRAFQKYDKVLWKGQQFIITTRRRKGAFAIKQFNKDYFNKTQSNKINPFFVKKDYATGERKWNNIGAKQLKELKIVERASSSFLCLS